jgi:hypothetical protein
MGSFIDLDGKWRASRDLTFKGLFNLTRGVGKTDLDQGVTFARYGTGVSYRMGASKTRLTCTTPAPARRPSA